MYWYMYMMYMSMYMCAMRQTDSRSVHIHRRYATAPRNVSGQASRDEHQAFIFPAQQHVAMYH